MGNDEDVEWTLLLVKAELIKAISKMRLEIDSGDTSHQRVFDILELCKEVIEHFEAENKQLKEIADFAYDIHTRDLVNVKKKWGVCGVNAEKLLCDKIDQTSVETWSKALKEGEQ